MNKKDNIFLAEAYEQVLTTSYVRSELLKEGYTDEQIDYLFEAGIMDRLKSFGKKAVLPAAVAASMLVPGKAQAQDVQPQPQRDPVQAMQAIQSNLQARNYVSSIASKAQEHWQKQDINSLKKLRDEFKTAIKVQDNKELDKLIDSAKGDLNFEGINLLKTNVLGN